MNVRVILLSTVVTIFGLLVSCKKEKTISLPVLSTESISSVTDSTAISGGNVTNSGNDDIVARGICWSLSENPTISDSKTSDGIGSGTFASKLNKLKFATTYHVRAYATNSVGTSYGNDLTFTTTESMYFPADTAWETKSLTGLNWNQSAVQPLNDFLIQKHTKSFMILVNGRIVMEEYFNGHSKDSAWAWNSAGKTLVSATIGIAQQEGLLDINNKASQYLGTSWTKEPLIKENLITVRNLLTMTSGINDSSELVIKSNLTYLADAGTRWSYHNVFQKLMDVVSNASGLSFETYFNSKIKAKIGMEGRWNFGLIYHVYHSNTRSMARFGLLALNKGKWKNEQILNESFFNDCIRSSQTINPSYGYLWWLNGKTSYMVPGEQTVFQEALVPNAPSDMYAAMGAEDQRIYVIPGKNMIVIRMGDASDPQNPSFAVSGFDNALWEKINAVIN